MSERSFAVQKNGHGEPGAQLLDARGECGLRLHWRRPLERSIIQAVELAKTPRAPIVKPKTRDKGRGKAKEEEQSQVPQFEYYDGTMHDSAMRAHLIRGYEQFKVRFRVLVCSSGADATFFLVDPRFLLFYIVFIGTTSVGVAARAILYRLGVDVGSRKGF